MTPWDEAAVKAFGDQPDPSKLHFVAPKAVRIVSHRGRDYVMFCKQDGTFAATRILKA